MPARGLDAIEAQLSTLDEPGLDDLRARLCIGLHWNVEVTDEPEQAGQIVSQALCSALPVAYTGLARQRWSRFAPLVLEATYEATLLAGLLNARRGGSNIVLLTHLGGGAFGNDPKWIDAAMRRALALLRGQDLQVRIVSYGAPAPLGPFSS